jgi:two-component system phosphate regulon sensor histidine kinase PhoR
MTFWVVLTVLVALGALAAYFYSARKLDARLRSAREEIDRINASHATTLAELRAQQEAIFNSIHEGLLVLDGSGRVRACNRAFRELFGTDVDPIGRSLLEILRIHDLADLLHRLEREDRVLGCEFRYPGPTERIVEVNATVVRNQAGDRQGIVLVFHDLSRVKQLEKSGSELIANVSHELRTPVSMIKGYIEAILSSAKDDPATLQRFLATIERHANRLAMLIEDLLTSAELESGRAVLNLSPVSLRSVVDDVMKELEHRARSRGIAMTNDLPDVVVLGDADRLQQVFTNLLDNAIKYGKPEGKVIVGAIALDENRIQAHVSDDGPGIPPEAIPRIFDRFYRVDKSRSRDQGGTGLGLSIVRDIVRAHGGEVWVQSKPGQGTTFFLTLRRPSVDAEPA